MGKIAFEYRIIYFLTGVLTGFMKQKYDNIPLL